MGPCSNRLTIIVCCVFFPLSPNLDETSPPLIFNFKVNNLQEQNQLNEMNIYIELNVCLSIILC